MAVAGSGVGVDSGMTGTLVTVGRASAVGDASACAGAGVPSTSSVGSGMTVGVGRSSACPHETMISIAKIIPAAKTGTKMRLHRLKRWNMLMHNTTFIPHRGSDVRPDFGAERTTAAASIPRFMYPKRVLAFPELSPIFVTGCVILSTRGHHHSRILRNCGTASDTNSL